MKRGGNDFHVVTGQFKVASVIKEYTCICSCPEIVSRV